MGIKAMQGYYMICDICGDYLEENNTYLIEESITKLQEIAKEEYDWECHEGKWFCPQCAEWRNE